MHHCSILIGNTTSQQSICNQFKEILSLSGFDVNIYPFADADYLQQMERLLSSQDDFIIAYGLDILNITMTGGDYYINKLTRPVLILLDEPLEGKISLFTKRFNVTILFYTTIKENVTALRELPQPVFCKYVPDFSDIKGILDQAALDLYEDI